jgi:DNA-binding NarL/FixJ family response regulator
VLAPPLEDAYDSLVPPRKPDITVLIVDDHRMVAEALRLALDRHRDLRVVDVAAMPDRAEALARDHEPSVAVVQLGTPGRDGVEAVRAVVRGSAGTRVVGMGADPGEMVLARAVEAGMRGHVSTRRPLTDLAEAVRRAARDEPLMEEDEARRLLRFLRHRRDAQASDRRRADRLTPREVQILQRMAEGASRDEIAGSLGIRPATLRTHVQNILFKLGVHSKAEALALVIRHGKVTTQA